MVIFCINAPVYLVVYYPTAFVITNDIITMKFVDGNTIQVVNLDLFGDSIFLTKFVEFIKILASRVSKYHDRSITIYNQVPDSIQKFTQMAFQETQGDYSAKKSLDWLSEQLMLIMFPYLSSRHGISVNREGDNILITRDGQIHGIIHKEPGIHKDGYKFLSFQYEEDKKRHVYASIYTSRAEEQVSSFYNIVMNTIIHRILSGTTLPITIKEQKHDSYSIKELARFLPDSVRSDSDKNNFLVLKEMLIVSHIIGEI